MQNHIQTIIRTNRKLLGSNPKVEKINVGFTNTLYNINDKFILKICSHKDNEENFLKEINFYKTNENIQSIPKLFISNCDKKDVPYYYEIIEKIDGVSLYHIWHTLSEQEREEIIKKLCSILKQIHKNTGKRYDWNTKISSDFLSLYNKAKAKKLFNNKEQLLLDKAYSKFKDLLVSKEFVLVHNDLHFDNIFFNNSEIKIIDFERSLYAPKDFELDILYKMIRKPWKYASAETEKYTKLADYKNIMSYIEKYYPELINIDNLYKRLAIYDIVYYLKHYNLNPDITELKEDVLNAAKNVI